MVWRKDQSPVTKLRERAWEWVNGYGEGVLQVLRGYGDIRNRDHEVVGVASDGNSSLASGVRGRFVSHLRLNANIGKLIAGAVTAPALPVGSFHFQPIYIDISLSTVYVLFGICRRDSHIAGVCCMIYSHT